MAWFCLALLLRRLLRATGIYFKCGGFNSYPCRIAMVREKQKNFKVEEFLKMSGKFLDTICQLKSVKSEGILLVK